MVFFGSLITILKSELENLKSGVRIAKFEMAGQNGGHNSANNSVFVFVAPLRFPRNPFLFPLPPELSFVVRYRATQTQRKKTAAKATVVNKKI